MSKFDDLKGKSMNIDLFSQKNVDFTGLNETYSTFVGSHENCAS
jgi:hypothetical protein